MLIEANRLLHRLDQELAELAAATMTNPPVDYPSFMRVVGKYQAKLEAHQLVQELARMKEE